MTVRQISVFVENRAGRLSAITSLIGEAGVNIRAISIADSKDFGIMRLIVSDTDKALEALKSEGCSVTVSSMLAVEISDTPKGMAKAMDTLYKDNISVEYMYSAFINTSANTAYLILRVDNNEQALVALKDAGYNILTEDSLTKI